MRFLRLLPLIFIAAFALSTPAFAQSTTKVTSTESYSGGTSQPVTQASGTSPAPNVLNGIHYARQFQTGGGNNGITNLMASSEFSGGGVIIADPFYAYTDTPGGMQTYDGGINVVGMAFTKESQFYDYRAGTYANVGRNWPKGVVSGVWDKNFFGCIQDQVLGYVPGSGSTGSNCIEGAYADAVPGFDSGTSGFSNDQLWSSASITHLTGMFIGQGIHNGSVYNGYCNGTGDCNWMGWYLHCKTAVIAGSDEGCREIQANVAETPPYTATIATGGGGSGATTYKTTGGNNFAGLGDGHPLIDLTDDVIRGCSTSITPGIPNSTVALSGCSGGTMTASTVIGVLGSAISINSRTDGAATPVTISIPTSVAVSNGQLMQIYGGAFFEVAKVSAAGSVVGGQQSITINLRHSHASGESFAVGGLAGRYLEVTKYTSGAYLYVMNVVASPTTSTILVSVQTSLGPGAYYNVENLISGTVNIYHGTTLIDARDPLSNYNVTGNNLALGADNDAAWLNGASIENTNNINGGAQLDKYGITAHNPYVPTQHELVLYGGLAGGGIGAASLFGGDHTQVINGATPSTLVGQGGNLYPFFAGRYDGVWNGFEFQHYPQATTESGQVLPGSLLTVRGCVAGAVSCVYNLWQDYSTGDTMIMTPSTDSVEFYNQFRSMTLKVQGSVQATNSVQSAMVATTSTTAGFQEVLYTPASSSAVCTAGQFTDDANYHYVCIATNTWKRVALSSF